MSEERFYQVLWYSNFGLMVFAAVAACVALTFNILDLLR
jgi:hypothetical protein